MLQLIRFVIGLLLAACVGQSGLGQSLLQANDGHVSLLDSRQLDGKWLFESAVLRQQDRLDQVWTSVVSISSNGFTISNFLAPSKELKGRIHFDEASGNQLDLELEELDFSDLGEPVKLEAQTLKCLVEFDGDDAMAFAMNTVSPHERPTAFESTDSVLIVRLRRAPQDFKEFPKDVAFQVETADGRPAEGAIAARFQSKRTVDGQADGAWNYSREMKTDAAGIVVFPYEQLPRLVIDEKGGQIAFPKLIPSMLVDGKVTVKLAPACEVRGSIVCEQLAKAEQPIGWTNVYLEAHGNSVMNLSSENGEFDFLVPAGEYKLEACGGKLSRRRVSFSVEPNQSELTVDPISLRVLALVLLKGKPAPEFVEVAGWSGEPVKLSNLKGKHVLVDFWGYWCGPCVGAMPILIELHEKYGDKGLAIVGVHVDAGGEVDSSEKLKEKTKLFESGIWQGKELPFPNALVSGEIVGEGDSRQPGGTPGIYGIQSFPTTILIDPNGNVVGEFPVHDLEDATERIEKLLKTTE